MPKYGNRRSGKKDKHMKKVLFTIFIVVMSAIWASGAESKDKWSDYRTQLLGTKSSGAEPKDTWLDPTESSCTNNKGKWKDGEDWDGEKFVKSSKKVCEARWNDAYAICRAIGGRLPSIEELDTVVTDCGGVIYGYNAENVEYQACYKVAGFTSSLYWSGTTHDSGTSDAWGVHFDYGNHYWYDMSDSYCVRCVRTRK